MLELYINIKKMRENRGLSQTELAKKTGYSDRSMISKIENGDVNLSLEKIISFAHALETSPAYLMGWESEDGIADLGRGMIVTGLPEKETEMLTSGHIKTYDDGGFWMATTGDPSVERSELRLMNSVKRACGIDADTPEEEKVRLWTAKRINAATDFIDDNLNKLKARIDAIENDSRK